MSGPSSYRCPVCRRKAWLTRAAVEAHLADDHSPGVLAAELLLRVYPPQPAKPPQPTVTSSCAKRKFATEEEALTALIGAALSRGANRAEKRSYYHARCGAWHLTKQDARPGQ